jgi:hypothetical protein
MFEVRGRDDDFRNWKSIIDQHINPSVKFIVFILPGAKGQGKCYKDIK